MKIRVGVIGPKDSVKMIIDTGADYGELHFIPFVYESTEETEQIIIRNREWVDQWLFSGQAPYFYALSKKVITKKEASYIPLSGASLLAVLVKVFLDSDQVQKRFSLDTIQEEEMDRGLDPLVRNRVLFQMNSYDGYMPAEEIIAFHKELYESNKVDVAITCLNKVYKELTKMNIPTYRIEQSELTVRRSLETIKEKGQASWYRKSQLVIIGVERIVASSESEERRRSFRLKHQELELKKVLLDVGEQMNGSIVQMDDGVHYIFTTRGELELFMRDQSMLTISEEIFVHSRLRVRIGVGFGLTVLEAEENVSMAFSHAREFKGPIVISVNEEKELTIINNEREEISFHSRIYGNDWEKIFKDAGISSKVVAKIESLSLHYQKNKITSQDLSHWLKSTDRNARRILMEMEKIGLAEIIGEETGHRGRPRKIYQLNFKQLAKL